MISTAVDASIRFNQVTYVKDDQQILKNISGIFLKEKITTIVGPSGAGKTTLFRLCNGLLSANTGEIYIGEENIRNFDPTHLRRTVGLALQNGPMISGTVFDNLELPLKLQGKNLNRDEAITLLNLVGLNENHLRHNINELSGGQRQKVSIARTLVNRPKILLLDEITSSLDIVSQGEIEELIIRINQTFGVTIAWITHNLQQAIQVGNYSWVLMNGELVESGETSLLQSPKDPRVQKFVKGEIQ